MLDAPGSGAGGRDAETSRFLLLNSGPEALRWRLALVDSATRALDVQTLIWRLDAAGALLMDRLLRAADRGVRVRLLIDDSFLSGEDPDFMEIQRHPMVEIRVFNPYQKRSPNAALRFVENLNRFNRVNHRMHNKVFAADDRAAIVGGRNIANEYFGFSTKRNFRDFDLLAAGSVVPKIVAGFERFWNSGWAYPISALDHDRFPDQDLEALRNKLPEIYAPLARWAENLQGQREGWKQDWFRFTENAIPGRARVLQDDPAFQEGYAARHVAAGLRRLVDGTCSEMVLATAYLVPTRRLADGLADAVERGVDVRVLTNSLASNNHVPAHAAYRHRRRELLQNGIKLHEYRRDPQDRVIYQAPGFDAGQMVLHAKVGVFDRKRVLAGSLNLDSRSLVLNTELGMLVESEPLAREVQEALETDFRPENSWHLSLDQKSGRIVWRSADGVVTREPQASLWWRIKDSLAGALPIDDEM